MGNIFFCKNTPLWSEKEEMEQLAKLPKDFVYKIGQYKNIEDRQLRIRSKLLLLKSLQILGYSNELNDMKFNPFGKPFFNDGPNFNLSHSENLVTCVISSECQVGIDTEVYNDKNVEEYLSFVPTENRIEIEASPSKPQAFLEYWTKFEATVKVLGKGLYISLDQVQLNQETAIVEDRKWYVKTIPISEYHVTSIATSAAMEVMAEEVFL